MVVTRRTALGALVAGGIGTIVGAATYGVSYARHHLDVVRASLPVTGLPPAFENLRIGLITDLHHSGMVPIEDVLHAAALLQAEHPDLIVLGGDYVTLRDRRYMAPCAEALAGLTAPLGVYAVLGNHDDDREMPATLASNRFSVLRDARTTISLRGEKLDLAGIRFWTQRPHDIARVLQGAEAPVVLLAHDPRRLSEGSDLGVALVLSGHTHGGQVNLPLLGPIAAHKFPIVAGSGRRKDTGIFVSRGVGTVYLPYRLNCPPDVALLTLKAA